MALQVRPPPIGGYEPQVPVEEGLRRIIPYQSGVSTGSAIADVGDAVGQIAESEGANYATRALGAAQSEWTQHLIERQQTAAPGAPGFTQGLMKDYQAYVDKSVQGAPNANAGHFLASRLNEFGTQLSEQALRFEAQQRVDHNVTVAQQSIDSAGNELMLSPQNFPQRLAERRELIGAMNMDGNVREKLWDQATQSLARYATMGAIRQDPYGAMQELASDAPKQLYTKVLTPELRQQFLAQADQALHSRVADAERVHELTKQQQQDAADGIIRQGVLLSHQGKLTPDWVTDHASLLKGPELNYLYKQAAGQNATTDPHVYASLLDQVEKGGNVTADAKQALFSGQLDKSDYTRLVTMGTGKQPSWYTRGMTYIRTAGQVSQMEPDPAKATSLANMTNDWQDWTQAHPSATVDQAESQYMDIVRRYQLVRGNQNILTLPVPQFGLGRGTRAAPDMRGAKQAAVTAFEQGQINRSEFEKQARLLQQWQASVDALQGHTVTVK
jgi:hypothetical protein